MGLLGYMAAGAAERGGAAVERMGLTQIEANIREEQAKRIAEHTSGLAEGVNIRAETRGLANRATERAAIVDENIANAPRLREQKIADALEMQTALDKYNRDPTNVEAKAVADAAAKKYAATAEAALLNDLMKDPKWLQNKKTLMNIEHPERAASAAASMAAVAKHRFELETTKELVGARKKLAEVQGGDDTDAIKVARDRVSALEGTAGKAQQTADATVLNSVAREATSLRTELRAETAALLKAKEDLAAAPEDTASHRASVKAAQERVTELATRERAQAALVQQLQTDYQRQYGARVPAAKPKGLINATPELSPLDAPARPALSNFRTGN